MNTLLSISGGTILYMLLVQRVFLTVFEKVFPQIVTHIL